MGEFELSYFEVNKGKNKAKYLSHQMHNYSKSYKSIERKLKGQKGLGLESVREQLVTLSNKCDYVSNDLEQIGLFLEQVISLTEQADNDARKLLESFSMRKVDRVIKYTKEVIKDALKTVFAAWEYNLIIILRQSGLLILLDGEVKKLLLVQRELI